MSTTSPTTLPRRNRLLSSCAVAALATLTVHMPVRAQAVPDVDRGFQGSGNPLHDGAFIRPVVTGSKNTTVEINAPRAIINWTPTDNASGTAPIDFLPNGHSADFINNSDRFGQDYIVLNRILQSDPNRPIAFNGIVRSTLSTVAAGAQGGQVWFYSPGGILVGSTGSFNVGSLLLTASDPAGTIENENAFLNSENNTFNFGPARSGSFVEVQGNISAVSRNSYVALIAPRVVQSGTVTVNGSAAYVAAEAATMTISGSLFDIEVTQGSGFGGSGSGDAALVHDGTTTIRNEEVGYGETGYGDSPTARTAIMVAVPKNDAVTMLVQGNIAYQQATNVEQVNGRIILSGSNDVRLDPFSQTHNFQANAATGKADILVSNAEGRSRFDTDVDAQATGIAKATAIARNQTETGYGGVVTPLDDLSFGGRLDLEGLGGASLEALSGSRIDVAGRLDIDASGTNAASTARASLIARAGSDIDIGSSTTVEAGLSASGASGDAVNLRTAEILAEGGRIEITGEATVDAAAGVANRGSSGVNVEGGTAKVTATGGGEIRTTSDLTVDASAFGAGCCSGSGGDAKGGTAQVESGVGSLIRSGGNLGVYADGAGGFGGEGGVGAGLGGVASILATGGAIEIANTLFVEANGFGGISFDGDVGYGFGKGGDAILGISTVATNVGRISVGNIEMEATGSAGFFFGGEEALFLAAANGSGGGAGDAEGGRVTATIDGVLAPFNPEGSTSMELRADAFGSRGSNAGSGPAQAGGDAVGGAITVEFRSGTTSLDSLSASADGIGADGGSDFGSSGGDGAVGGSGHAGAITIRATGGEASIGDLSIGLNGIGGEGGAGGSVFGRGDGRNGGNGGNGGSAEGGDLTVSASGAGRITVTASRYDVTAEGGAGGRGGDAEIGYGGNGGAGGNGGEAQGGTIEFTALDGGVLNVRPTAFEDGYGNTFYSSIEMDARAQGGRGGHGGYGVSGGNGGLGGIGTGGSVLIDVTSGGAIDFRPDVSDPVLTLLRLLANGDGGDGGDGEEGGTVGPSTSIGGNGGNAGLGKAGSTTISVTDATLSLGDVELSSAGHGGEGGSGAEAGVGGNGGRGGDGEGGAATFSLSGAVNFTQTPGGDIELQAYGLAGDGGNGGTGTTEGGVSGAGGNGVGGGGIGTEGPVGGGITINLSADNVTVAHITARAKGDGGMGGSGFFGGEGGGGVAAEGGSGGTGTGGSITLTSSQGVNSVQQRIKFSANGEGGTGGSSASLAGGNGGKGLGGTVEVGASGSGELNLVGATLNAYGLGGSGNSGGTNEIGGNGGRGGDATGGTVRLATLQQGRITLAAGEGGGDLQANAYARGGSAGSGGNGTEVGDTGGRGGNGGDATAGLFAIAIAGGTVTLGSVTGDANAQGGSAGSGGTGAGRPDDPITEGVNEFVPATPAPGGTGGNATGGAIRIDVADGDGDAAGALTAGSVNLFASGFGGSGDVGGSSSAGTVGIFETARAASGSIRFANLNVEAFGDNAAHAVGFELDTDTGPIDVDGSVNIDVSNDVSMIGRGSGMIVAGFEVDVDAGGTISLTQDPGATVPLIQADFVDLDAEGSILGATAGILAQESIEASGFNVSLGRLTTTNPEFGGEASSGIRVDAFGEAFIGSADSASTIVVNAGGLTGGTLKAQDFVSITVNSEAGTTGSVDIDGAEAGEFVRIEASNDVAADRLIAGSNVSVGTFGNVTIGTAEAGEDVRIDGGTITLASGTAGRDVLLNASDFINVGFAQAGDDFRAISSNGAVTAENVITTGLGEDISESGYGPGDGTNVVLDAQDDARLNNGLTPGAIRLTSSTGSVLSAGTLDAQRLDASAAQNIALTDVIVDASLFLSASGGVSGRNFTSDGDIALSAGGDISLTGTARAGGEIFASGRNVSLVGAVTEGTFTGGEGGSGITIFANDQASIGTADSASFISVRARGFTGGSLVSANETDIRALGGEGGPGTGIDVDAISAGTFVTLVADASVTADNVTASNGSIFVSAGNAATLGTLLASRDIDASAASISLSSGTAGRDVLLEASGAISVGFAQAGDDFEATSTGGAVTANSVVTTGLGEDLDESGYGPGDGTNIVLDAQGDARLNNGLTPGAIRLTSSTRSVLSAGTLDAQRLDASAAQNIALTDVIVDDSLFLSASGGVSGRNFTSAGDIALNAGGDIALTGTARAGGEIFASARNVSLAGAVTDGTFTGGEGGSGITVFADDQASIGTADSASFILVRARGFSGGSLVSADQTDIRALGGEGGPGTGIDVDAVTAGTFVSLVADAGVTADALTASNGSVLVSAGNAATLGTLLASRDIAVSADSISLASGTAARDIVLAASGAIGVTAAQAGDDFEANSETGAFTGGTIVTTGLGEDTTETGYGQGPGDGSNILVDAAGSIRLDNGNAPDLIRLTANNGRIDSAGLIETTQFDASATSDIALTDVDVVNDLSLTTSGGSISGRALASQGDVRLDANGNVTVQEARAGDDISIMAGGTALVGAAMAPGTGTDSEGDGFNIDIEAVGNVSFGSAETVGNLRLVSQQGGILRLGAPEANLIEAGGNVFVSSAFDLNLSAVNAGGDITLASQGAIDTGSLTAGDDMSLQAGGALSVDAAKAGGELFAQGTSIEFGSVEIGGALTLGTPGALVLGTASAGSISGSGSTVTAGTLTTPGSIALTATTGEVSVATATAGSDIVLSGNGVTLTDGTAGRDIRLASAGNIGVGTAKAGDDFDAEASGAFTGTTVITTGEGPDAEDGENGYGTVALAANDGSNITITATGAIALATGTAADTVDLTSSQASIASSSALTAGGSLLGTAATTIDLAQAKAGQAVDLEAGGNLTAARIEAGTGVTLASSGGAVLVSQDLKSGQPVVASGRAVTLNAQGALAVRSATASAGNVALTSVGNLQVERADASAQVNASSGGTLGLTGQVNGTQISLASRDIAIGSNAQVGTTQRTTGIQITANGAGSPVVIGGSASGSGYRLDNAEFARLASRDVTISSQGEASSMQIDALTVRGAGASNSNVTGRLSFAAGGDVEMTGRLAFDTATEANSVRVSAGRNFFADAAGAGIAVTNGSALAGSVEIDARSIVIASRAAGGELGSINNIDDRSDRLGQNDSTTPDNAGFVRAGGIRLSASEKIHVQNSGINSDESDDRAGLLAGAGGITLVTNSSTTPVEIIINGRQVNPAGGEFTGEALIDELTIVGANGGQANFAARSTVNGCLITGVNCGVIILPESPLTRAKDLIEELEQEDSATRPPAIGFSRLIDIEGGPLLSVVDEPVTGTGNEDVYLSEDALDPVCPDDRTDCVVDEPVTGTGNETLQSEGLEAPLTQLPPVRPQDQQPDANGPVTGIGNESLQSDPPRED